MIQGITLPETPKRYNVMPQFYKHFRTTGYKLDTIKMLMLAHDVIEKKLSSFIQSIFYEKCGTNFSF